MKIDSNRRSVDLDPRQPRFYQHPYPAYHAIRGKLPIRIPPAYPIGYGIAVADSVVPPPRPPARTIIP